MDGDGQSGHGFHRRRLAGALEHDHIEVYVKVTRDGDYFVFHALAATRYRVEIGKEARKMTVRITAKDQAIMDEMVGEADRGELIFHQEAALCREPGGPALSDEELGAIMITGLQRLGAQGDEDQTT